MGIEMEKKLTDEEWFEKVFVKTVEFMEKFCKNRKELSKDIDIVGRTDNEEESVKFNRRIVNYVRSLQAEIERLASANMQTIGKNAELLLKVDELKEQNAQLSEMADYDKGHKEGYEHGVKTTAKEILTDAKKWVKEHYKDTVTDSFGERPMLFMEAFGGLLAYLKDKHGVEVE